MGLIITIFSRTSISGLNDDLSEQIITGRAAEADKWIAGHLRYLDAQAERVIIRRGNVEEIRAELRVLHQNKNSETEMLFYILPDGRGYDSTGNMADLSDREYFKAIFRDNKKSYVSNAIISRVSNQPVFVVARAVQNDAGRTEAMLISTVTLKR
jgi:hypothetical protein